MLFEDALTELKDGKKIKKSVWSDNMYLKIDVGEFGKRKILSYNAYTNNTLYFIFEQDDLFSEDWEIVKDDKNDSKW